MVTAITLLSAVVVLLPGVDLFGIMMVAQVINGVLLPVLLVFMVRIADDRHVMGAYANGSRVDGAHVAHRRGRCDPHRRDVRAAGRLGY